MSTQNYAALGVGSVAFVFAVLALATGGPGERDVEDMIASEIEDATEEVSGLQDRIAELEAALEAATADASSAADVAAVSDSVAALATTSEETQAALAALTEQGSATSDAVAALSGDVAALADRVTGAESAAASASEAASAAAEAATAATATAAAAASSASSASDSATDAAPAENAEADAAPMAEEGGLKVGQTALFADGALRIFVSRVLADEGAARLTVNGDTEMLGAGDARTVAVADDYCRYTLDGVGAGGAALSALCGDELPAPEGLSPGQTAILADGAVRVFASWISDDAARVFANDETVTLAVGRSAPIPAVDQSCRVAVDAIDRGHVTVSAACGEDVAVSALAGVGSTVVLGDGAARVFVSKVADGSVRFAVNGQETVMGASGDSAASGEGCSVTVEDVVERKASFSYACDG